MKPYFVIFAVKWELCFIKGSCRTERVLPEVVWQDFCLIGRSVAGAPFTFFEMQMKCWGINIFEFGKPDLRSRLKALYTIHMNSPSGKFILQMVNAEMPIAKINQSVISARSIRIYNKCCHSIVDNVLQRVFKQSGKFPYQFLHRVQRSQKQLSFHKHLAHIYL